MSSRRIFAVVVLVGLSAFRLSSQTVSNFRAPGATSPTAEPANPYAPAAESSILKNISEDHGFIASADGACLFYRHWSASGDAQPKYVVLILHGIGLHSGVYRSAASELNQSGIAVYAVDTRGHGLSCGERGHVPEPATETGDIGSMLEAIRQRNPQAHLFLMGESMGAIFALNYAKENSQDISGLILLSPVFAVNPRQYMQFKTWRYLPDLLFSRDRRDIGLQGRGSGDESHDGAPAVPPVPDGLTYDKVSVNYILGVQRNKAHWSDTAMQVRVPTLVMKGNRDQVSAPGSARKAFDLIATQDKEYDAYPNVEHSLLASSQSPEILGHVSGWIVKH